MDTTQFIYKKAITGGIISTIINGIITWFKLDGKENIPFTLDQISNTEMTVFGSVFPVVLSLCFILGIINYFTFKKNAVKENLIDPELLNKPFYPSMLKFIFSKTITAFGFLLIIAIFWQKYAGVIYANRLVTTLVIGAAAGLTSVYIAVSVSKEIVREK